MHSGWGIRLNLSHRHTNINLFNQMDLSPGYLIIQNRDLDPCPLGISPLFKRVRQKSGLQLLNIQILIFKHTVFKS